MKAKPTARLLSCLLALAMVCTMLPVAAFADGDPVHTVTIAYEADHYTATCDNGGKEGVCDTHTETVQANAYTVASGVNVLVASVNQDQALTVSAPDSTLTLKDTVSVIVTASFGTYTAQAVDGDAVLTLSSGGHQVSSGKVAITTSEASHGWWVASGATVILNGTVTMTAGANEGGAQTQLNYNADGATVKGNVEMLKTAANAVSVTGSVETLEATAGTVTVTGDVALYRQSEPGSPIVNISGDLGRVDLVSNPTNRHPELNVGGTLVGSVATGGANSTSLALKLANGTESDTSDDVDVMLSIESDQHPTLSYDRASHTLTVGGGGTVQNQADVPITYNLTFDRGAPSTPTVRTSAPPAMWESIPPSPSHRAAER